MARACPSHAYAAAQRRAMQTLCGAPGDRGAHESLCACGLHGLSAGRLPQSSRADASMFGTARRSR
eukprot:4924238-Prymnesium_polylepis.1